MRGPAIAAIACGVVLAVAGGLVAWFWHGPAPLEANPVVDAAGQDALQVQCASCPDGTQLRIGTAVATVRANTAELALPSPLEVGDNRLTVQIDRPGAGRDEKVELVVPIGYRIRPDLSALDSDRPSVRLLVKASEATRVAVEGTPVSIGPDGQGVVDVDISRECSGTANEPGAIEKRIAYQAESHGKVSESAVMVRVPIPALQIDTPNAHAVIEVEGFLVSGRTGRGASISIAGQNVPTSAEGAFSAIVRLGTGTSDIVVRAHAPGHAPRIAHLDIKRVARLLDEARDFAARAKVPFATLTKSPEAHIGELASLDGDVVEARPQGRASIVLLDTGRACADPPCFARVVLASGDTVARGEHLRVFGRVTRAFRAPTTDPAAPARAPIPEIAADFFLRGK